MDKHITKFSSERSYKRCQTYIVLISPEWQEHVVTLMQEAKNYNGIQNDLLTSDTTVIIYNYYYTTATIHNYNQDTICMYFYLSFAFVSILFLHNIQLLWDEIYFFQCVLPVLPQDVRKAYSITCF